MSAINLLSHVDRATGESVRRYEHDHPGVMLHVDVKKLGELECLVFFGRWVEWSWGGVGSCRCRDAVRGLGGGSFSGSSGVPGRWPGWPDRVVLWRGRSGAGSQDGGGSAPVSALMP